jgi:hypothetical protein
MAGFLLSATGLFIELRSIGFRFSFRQKIGVRGSIPALSGWRRKRLIRLPQPTLKTRQTSHSRTINHIKIMPLEKYFLT